MNELAGLQLQFTFAVETRPPEDDLEVTEVAAGRKVWLPRDGDEPQLVQH